MTASRGDSYAGGPLAPARGEGLLRRRALVVAAALLLGAAAIATAVFALPKAWQVATGSSKQAGREFAAHWMQSRPTADVPTTSDIDLRCYAAADRAATQGVDLDDGRHLAPGRIMRAQFGPACVDEVRQHLALHQ